MIKHALLREIEQLDSLLKKRKVEPTGKLKEYGYGSIDLQQQGIARAKENILTLVYDSGALYRFDRKNHLAITGLIENAKSEEWDLPAMKALAQRLLEPENGSMKIPVPENMPPAIRPQVGADIRELEKAYNAECYRAATILVGRILETCLHRKYYEATGVDILEKNPGIGLGKLIAKLAEKNVEFDPGLTQQIHLINQVRIHSVHVKKNSFYPSRGQAHAMILYMVDVVGKMF